MRPRRRGEFDGIVTAHVRNDAVGAVDSFEEFSRSAGAPACGSRCIPIGSRWRPMGPWMPGGHRCLRARGVTWPWTAILMTLFSTYIGATTYDDGFTERYGDDLSRIELTEGEYKGPVQSMEIFQRSAGSTRNTSPWATLCARRRSIGPSPIPG